MKEKQRFIAEYRKGAETMSSLSGEQIGLDPSIDDWGVLRYLEARDTGPCASQAKVRVAAAQRTGKRKTRCPARCEAPAAQFQQSS